MDRDFDHEQIIDQNQDARATDQSRQERPPEGSKRGPSNPHDRPADERTVYELRDKSCRGKEISASWGELNRGLQWGRD
jgi:hypothetical protein